MIILSIPFLIKDFVLEKAKEFPDYWKEFRLDYSKDLDQLPIEIIDEKTILTIRDTKEGGKNYFDLSDKIEFYKKMISQKKCLCDLEINLVKDSNIYAIPANNIILSHHDHSDEINFTKLKKVMQRSNTLPSRFLKIAVNINKYSDLLEISKLIYQSNKPVIFAGMGKLGKLSRIMCRHLGADATFIGLPENPTANGQLTPQETELFKLNSITKKTKIGGIIGGEQIEHSIGLQYYNDLFKQKKLDAVYLPFVTDDFNDLWNWIMKANFDFYGFSITMPFKKIIGAKKQLSVINLFLPKTGKMLNTDLVAFQQAIETLKVKNSDFVLIVGSGATAEVALTAFINFDNITLSNRNIKAGKNLAEKNNRNYISSESLKNLRFDLVINCTPIGTKGEELLDMFSLKLPKKVIDLPYIQENTLLISRCIENQIEFIDGKKFWQLQAEEQQQKFIAAIENSSA